MRYLTRLLFFVAVGVLLLGFAQEVDASSASSAAGGWDILGQHTVRPGETLFCIGRAYGVDPWAIATQSNLTQPSRIYSGMVLTIPDVPTELPLGPVCAPQFDVSVTTPAPAGPAADATAASGSEVLSACGGCVCRSAYTVAPGDTLTRIALLYGSDIWSVARCNCIQNVNLIRIGDQLCIP